MFFREVFGVSAELIFDLSAVDVKEFWFSDDDHLLVGKKGIAEYEEQKWIDFFF